MELLVATTNPGKFKEVSAFLKDLPLQIVPLTNLLDPPGVIEDGLTFEENALKKARALADFSGLLTLADDSGLEVDALNGGPGIYSARYAGAACDDNRNNQRLLSELKGVPEPKRTARFVCALALCSAGSTRIPDWTVREACEGRIAFSLHGKHGFGYDPLFFFRRWAKLSVRSTAKPRQRSAIAAKRSRDWLLNCAIYSESRNKLDFEQLTCRMTAGL